MTRAAVLTAIGAPLRVTGIELPDPGPGQVRVRIAAAGVCHSDLSLANGTLRQPVPAVLGHEGSGTVTAVGEGVTHVAPGDEVVLNWAPACRDCHFCRIGEPWLCAESLTPTEPYATLGGDGTPLHPALGTAVFAEETVVRAAAVLPLPAGVPLTDAALLGCAVLTGYGAVHHSARVRAGESVVVVGVGGVGLATVRSARLAGAGQVIAVDVSPEKEELARSCGATDFVPAGDDAVARVRELTGGHGADVAIECVGRPETIRTAWTATRRGGRTTVVGVGGRDQRVAFSPLELFHSGRTLAGCVYGNTDPARDLPVLAEHVREGRFDLSALITRRIGLDDIPDAFDAMLAGRGGRSLVVF
ncbi:Zn-dependent alcohol dehydrogenase [Streptomyces mobaraensis NBRC 13819 = DSM 40847]|uniref:Putative alcohol dehydrogenase n=1 Tax=Streptomyces mobaraensis (strain ATCC 29032 / DSM 40847 / JCM 4168 / NBRC 13819 / NCIMB 11159 / IPCR 16-22) TaxID=1223523 RepID=M3A3A4_STRM1|nr:Zn-dependent alcohol dehydrogenase [Streptomyces mobaraensis]EME99523.1 putative alcohol dehydrogenase [Streptomyces mobaraensis NBRC 13819 = DSM 40847]QTT73099.1 Zn-dependent alcohol dehydrogenase [Streptomyces mobaraensis NBRC 13819 = DSM 40847]